MWEVALLGWVDGHEGVELGWCTESSRVSWSRGRIHHRTHNIAAHWTRTHRNIKADSQVRRPVRRRTPQQVLY